MKERQVLILLIKVMTVFIICFWAFVLAAHFTLSYIASLPSTKDKIVSTVKEQLSADISIGSISAGIFDLRLKDVSISIEGKNIADVDLIYARFALIHLIKGKLRVNNIIINGFNLTVIRDKNGKFNFDSLLNSPAFESDEKKKKKKKKKDEDEDEDVFGILINKINLNGFRIVYIDEAEQMSLILDKVCFVVKDLNLEKPFDVYTYFNVFFKNKDMDIKDLQISLSSSVNLNFLNLREAEVIIKSFVIRLKDTIIKTDGNISNFENPKIKLNTAILKLSSETFEGISELPKFLIPKINIKTLLNIELEKSILNIERFYVNVLDCSINAVGKIDYSDELNYNINAAITFILDKITQTVEMIEPYKITGEIKTNLNITSGSSVISGDISVKDVAAFLPQLGKVNDVNSDIKINSIDSISMPSLTGKMNSYPFVSSASYLADDKKGKLKANFFADRIYGKMSKEYEEQMNKKEEKDLKDANEQKIEQELGKSENVPQKTEIKTKNKSSAKPTDIEVYFKVNHINVPYFLGKDVKFKMNMLNVTPDLDRLEGTLSLTTADGTIKDIYKLTESNALMKGLFLSLKIASNVINALNVLDILNSIGSAVVGSNDKKQVSEMTEEDSENRKEKLDGQIDFLSFITAINFKEGKGVFKNCSFVSNLMSFKVAGNIDFKEDLVDMAVNAAPGRHEEDEGIMPLKMKITGTTDNPSGSLSVLGSISSLVKDTLTKNIVSGSLKSGFTKLLGLKKYDENGNDIEEEETTSKKKKKKKK